jgi:hypothetical protein
MSVHGNALLVEVRMILSMVVIALLLMLNLSFHIFQTNLDFIHFLNLFVLGSTKKFNVLFDNSTDFLVL